MEPASPALEGGLLSTGPPGKAPVRDLRTPLPPMNGSPRQNTNKETQTANDTTDQTDLIDI